MGLRFRNIVFSCIGLMAAAVGLAQEGHPLKGSWIGVWEGNDVHGESIVVILDWDGEKVSGMINPGTDNIKIDSVRLDPEDWSVRIEADAEDGSGGSLHYVLEGTIQELELPSRSIVGTWSHRNARGAFEIRRQ